MSECGGVEQALIADPGCVKALFRRAQAHRCRDNFTDAQADIQAALKLAPNDKLVRSEAVAIRVRGVVLHCATVTLHSFAHHPLHVGVMLLSRPAETHEAL